MNVNFSLEKEDKTETDSDVVFNDTSNIIGKALEIHVSSFLKTMISLTLINSLFCLTSSQQPASPWVLFLVTQINKLKVNLLLIDYD